MINMFIIIASIPYYVNRFCKICLLLIVFPAATIAYSRIYESNLSQNRLPAGFSSSYNDA